MDKNRDGSINTWTVEDVMRIAGNGITTEQAQEVFATAALDEHGISWDSLNEALDLLFFQNLK